MSPPLLLVSACLLGHRTRYNGGHKLFPALAGLMPERTRLFAFCPELRAGFGLPRPPLRLRGMEDGAIRVCRADGAPVDELELTERLETACEKAVNEAIIRGARGAVLKSRSPSCALRDAALITAAGENRGPGLFARSLRAALPALPLIDETEMADEEKALAFFRAVAAYAGSPS